MAWPPTPNSLGAVHFWMFRSCILHSGSVNHLLSFTYFSPIMQTIFLLSLSSYVGCILLHVFQKHMKNLEAQSWHLMQGLGMAADYCLLVCFVWNGQTDCRRLEGIKQGWFKGDLNEIKLFSSKAQRGITKIRAGFTKNEVLQWLKMVGCKIPNCIRLWNSTKPP